MEIKAELNNATEEQKVDFIVTYNHQFGYEIEQKIASEEETADEEGNVTKVYTYNLKAWGYTTEEIIQKERERLDALTLTPADVERALYRAKGMDFDDLKALIAQQIPQVDIKGLSIEFRAKDFYRGAMAGGMRLFDVVGQLLGYTSDDMDYLFEHRELPNESE